MDESVAILLFFLLLLGILALGVIGLITIIRWLVRLVSGPPAPASLTIKPPGPPLPPRQCFNCNQPLLAGAHFCAICGAARPSPSQLELLNDIAATLRQLHRLHTSTALDDLQFQTLKATVENERERILFPTGRPSKLQFVTPITTETPPIREPAQPRPGPEPAPDHRTERPSVPPPPPPRPTSPPVPPPYAPPKERRKPFAEVIAAFMEQSNIRWGEIVGGILIIGCSTALVVSLWAQISRIPVLKFLIFTTVTAALFSIGFYTEHRWKLPTTSRGILTIATLLVPLNFLAIAAVSAGAVPPGALVIGSELIAPAVFLCLVYFAGRVITPSWPHLLAAGVLGSSVGQLLIRHFASPENSPLLLVALGALPVVCYLAAAAWMLRCALADAEIDEGETYEIFITLGAITFAAALPFGLLLFKSGPIGMTMMYLAPLVTLAGTPMLGIGTLLWRHVTRKELAPARTAGTAIAILGMVAVLAGMILAWPNPASIVPAALFNFAVFTALAIFLELPHAHVFAAGCLTLAYVVTFQVMAGHVPWQNLRVTSLWRMTRSVGTGQALAIPFALFALTSEWLKKRRRESDGASYLIAAWAVAAASLLLVAIYGAGLTGDPRSVWAFFALYAAGAFWFAWRQTSVQFTWAGALLLFCTMAQVSGPLLSLRFPWQASLLLFSTACTGAAIASWRVGGETNRRVFVDPLKACGILGSVLASVLLMAETISRQFEPAQLLSTRFFWLALIWIGLLILSRVTVFFTALQIAIALGGVLAVKSFLQHLDWYGARPDAWMHPWALQMQGGVLAFTCLAWIGIRILLRRQLEKTETPSDRDVAARIVNLPLAFDHLLAFGLVLGFGALVVIGTMTGIGKELATPTMNPPVFNLGGFAHQLIFGSGGWILLAVIIAVMIGNASERRRTEFVIGALVALGIACPLLAGKFEAQIATASAWRWSAAIFLLGAAVLSGFRERLARMTSEPERAGTFAAMRSVLLFITLGPLLVLTIVPVLSEIRYLPPQGPQSGFFHAIGNVALYSVPLIAAAIALAIYGVRERAPGFAFASGLLINLTVTVVYLLSIVAGRGLMNRVVLTEAIQLNAIAAACVALLWLATRDWWMSPIIATEERLLLGTQKWIAGGLNIVVLVPAAIHLIAFPDRGGIGTIAVGSVTGWLALLLTLAVIITFDKVFRRPLNAAILCASLLAIGSLPAFAVARAGAATWLGFHMLLADFVLTAWLMLLARQAPSFSENRLLVRSGVTFADDWKWNATLFAAIVGAVTVVLALRTPFNDPTGAWWSIGALVAMSALAASLNWVTFKRLYLYAAGILFNVATFIWLVEYKSHQLDNGRQFIEANLIALALSSVLWLWLELRARRLAPKTDQDTTWSFHNLSALLSLLVIGTIVAVCLSADASIIHLGAESFRLHWAALTSVAILLIACLWDREAKYSVAALYLVGLMFAGMALHQLELRPRRLGWAAMMSLAIYALVVSLIWRGRAKVIEVAARFKIPPRIDPAAIELRWLTIFNAAAVSVVVWLAFWIDQRFIEWSLRATAALAVTAQAFTFGFMASGKWRRRWQRAAVAMFLAGIVFLGWSWLMPGTNASWLNRAVILMTEMFAIVGLFGTGLDKLLAREPDWTRAFRDCIPAMTIAGIVALAFTLGAEVYYRLVFDVVRINPLAQAVVGITLAGAVVICIFFAVSPKHDPLSLTLRWRSSYVYAAEAMLALLFMHIRLTMPWLFTGFFERYWPLVVVAISYGGIAVSEFLRRRKLFVLSDPIERTGVLLPLLPVLGFWVAASHVDYSTLLFVIGALYGVMSILRKSFRFGLAAALAANGGLWHLLQHTSDYHFLQHPQAWLIPIALSVLIAAQLNREGFTEPQMTSIRYLSLIVIYVSSTADIFINGVAQSPWLPPILAALAIAGVFCGIMFRIRAFLILGSIFLLLAITTMIYYASKNFGWTWLWYVAGIITGALIIATFAVFEKKRAEVLRVVDGLKDWER